MRNYIILNGKNSNEINGLLIQELPPISKPQIRTEIEEIDGRDGDIVTKLGFAAYDKEISVGLYKDFDINEIIAYFNSEGTIVFSNEPDKYYNYQIIDQIDFERLVRYRTATIRMHCQPFKYSTTQGTITKDASATVSDEGSNLVLENTAEAPFNKLEPKGNAEQQTYSGKNLMPMASADMTDSGVRQNNFRMNLPAGTYTVSFNLDSFTLGTNAAFTIALQINGAGGTLVQDITMMSVNSSTSLGRYNRTFTISADGTTDANDNVRIGATAWDNGARARLSNIQIEAGSTASDYEIYTGGNPAPNPDYPQLIETVTGEQTVKITGKNLLNPNKATTTSHGMTLTNNGDGSFGVSGTTDAIATIGFSAAYSIHLIAGQTYAISVNNPIAGEGQNMQVRLHKNGGGVYGTLTLNTVNKTRIYTPTENMDAYLEIRVASGYQIPSGFTVKPQIELGNQASEFEQYQEQSQIINLGSIELAKIPNTQYEDKPVKVGDTWYIHKMVGKKVITSIDRLYATTGEGFIGAQISATDMMSNSRTTGLCDKLTPRQSPSNATVECITYGANNQIIYIVLKSSRISDNTVSGWNAYLTENPYTVYYALATPVDEEITDATLIEQLEALAEAHSYKGRTHINATATGNNAPHIIAAEVGVDNESTVTNSGNINSKPVIKIYGSGNIGAYLNDIQILQIALGDEGYITIDTNLMEAYKDTLDNLKNRLVTGDYSKFSLKPGANKIHFSGTVTKYEISKYSRWL